MNNPQFPPQPGPRAKIENEGIAVTIMEINPTENDKYSRAASDAFLASLGEDVEAAATQHALKAIVASKQAQSADSTSTDVPVQSAATVATPTTTVSMTDEQRKAALALEHDMKQITDALRAGDLTTFAQRFSAAHLTPEAEYGNVAIAWLESYALSAHFNAQPTIGAWLLTDATAVIAQVPAKWRLGLVLHLVRSSKFLPTYEWLTAIGQLEDNSTFEHFFGALIQGDRQRAALYKLLENPANASAFVRDAALLKKIDSNNRMALTSHAIRVSDLPSQWAEVAKKIGFTDTQIGELLCLRCHKIQGLLLGEHLTENDERFLEELLQPAPEGGVSYRSVLSTDQLSTVVLVVRKRHPRRNQAEVEAAIRVMCLDTMRQRYTRSPRLA